MNIVDEITIEITKKTKEVTIDYVFLEDHKVLKINVCRNGRLLDHEVLTVRQQQINPKKLEWMNLAGPMNEVIYPVKVQLNKEYQAGERVHLTIEIMTTFRTLPEKKIFSFLVLNLYL